MVKPGGWKLQVPGTLGTNISPPKKTCCENDFPFPEVGYVSSLEGILNPLDGDVLSQSKGFAFLSSLVFEIYLVWSFIIPILKPIRTTILADIQNWNNFKWSSLGRTPRSQAHPWMAYGNIRM